MGALEAELRPEIDRDERGDRADDGAAGELQEKDLAIALQGLGDHEFGSFGCQSSWNTASTGTANSRAIRSASGRLGSYLSVSTALIVCRDTSSRRARSPWLQPRPTRCSLTLFFI